MSPHQTVAVAVRLFAAWLAVYVAREVLSFYLESSRHDDPHTLLIALSVSLVAAIVVLALWYFPQTVARKLLTSSAQEPALATPPDTWLAMGCALIGLWLLTTSLPALVRDLLILYVSRTTPDDTSAVQDWMLYHAVGFEENLTVLSPVGRSRSRFTTSATGLTLPCATCRLPSAKISSSARVS
jgi:hypothetical protein